MFFDFVFTDSTCHDLSTWCHMLKDWECENNQTMNACRKSCGKCYEGINANLIIYYLFIL